MLEIVLAKALTLISRERSKSKTSLFVGVSCVSRLWWQTLRGLSGLPQTHPHTRHSIRRRIGRPLNGELHKAFVPNSCCFCQMDWVLSHWAHFSVLRFFFVCASLYIACMCKIVTWWGGPGGIEAYP